MMYVPKENLWNGATPYIWYENKCLEVYTNNFTVWAVPIYARVSHDGTYIAIPKEFT